MRRVETEKVFNLKKVKIILSTLILVISICLISFAFICKVEEMNQATEGMRITVQDVRYFEQLSDVNLPDFQEVQRQSLMNEVEEKETITYKNHYFYAESINFELESEEVIESYSLIDTKTYEVISTKEYGTKINEGLNLRTLQEGDYFISLNDKILKANESVHEEAFYTITRDDSNYKVSLTTFDQNVILVVKAVEELPSDVYDLVIDPGHGGYDKGAEGTTLYESEEALKISKYLVQEFEEAGLKVKLTRSDESDPTGEENYSYKEAPYMDNGRISQVYETKSNYVISNHLNAYDTTQEGYQLFSSVQTTDEWTSLISQGFSSTNRFAFDSTIPSRVSYGSFKESYECDIETFQTGCLLSDESDYYYMIRETGGQLTHAYGLIKYNEEVSVIPMYGAETILVEYAFIDNEVDANLWLNEWQSFADVVVEATLSYLEIE